MVADSCCLCMVAFDRPSETLSSWSRHSAARVEWRVTATTGVWPLTSGCDSERRRLRNVEPFAMPSRPPNYRTVWVRYSPQSSSPDSNRAKKQRG